MSLTGKLIEILWGLAVDQGAGLAAQQVGRMRVNDALPRNEHIRHAIADSHVRALRRVTEQVETELLRQGSASHGSDTLALHEIEATREFCKAARKVIGSNLKAWLDPAKISATFAADTSGDVLTVLLGTSFLDERSKPENDGLRESALRHFVESTGYPEQDLPPLFRRFFDDPRTGYMANFAHVFRDWLKNPKNSQVFQIVAVLQQAQLREGLDRLHMLLESDLSGVAEMLCEQRKLWEQHVAQIKIVGLDSKAIYRPRLLVESGTAFPTATFRYERAVDEMVGRDLELYSIERDFLQPLENDSIDGMFRWHALCGDAGAGKSRFAMELVDRVADYWKIGGFVDTRAYASLGWVERLQAPAFLVVDYAGGRQGVDNLLRELGRRANEGELAAPVRVLLVDRRREDPLFQRLIAGTIDEFVRSVGPQRIEDITELRQLDDPAILKLMRARLGEKSHSYSDAALLSHLSDFDKRHRPLFAAIVASFLRTEALPEVDHDASAETARWTLFDKLIARWREQVWQESAPERNIKPYEQLAALVTIMRGMSVADHLALFEKAPAPPLAKFLPGPEQNDQIGLILGPLISGNDGSETYPAMEPDLLGECFVLGQAVRITDRGAHQNVYFRSCLTALLDEAWRLAPWQAAEFARRCYQNYPTISEAVRYLIPDRVGPAARLAKAMAVSSLIAEYVTRHEGRAEAMQLERVEPPSIAEQQGIMKIHALFDSDIMKLVEADADIGRIVAVATAQVINFLARAINEKIDMIDNPAGRILSDYANGLISSAVPSSRAVFNTKSGQDGHVLH